MPDDTQHILLTQRFLPEHGGSIRWMYEVYRRWPTPVEVITHDYYGHPPRTPEFPHAPERPAGGDHVTDANLRMDRRDIFIRDWGLEDRHRVARYWRMNRAVKERLRNRERVTVHAVHAVPEVASLIPLKWRYGNRLRVVCYAHGEEVTACCSSRQLTFLMHRAHGIIDVMLANSRYTAGVLRGHIDSRKVHVMNPGVDLAGFDGALDAGVKWRAEHGYTGRSGGLVVLTVGRLDPRKNHAAVIRAVAALKDRFPELRYVAAGEGRALPALKALAQQLNVADRVSFPGSVDGPTKLALYGACDVFAMPAIRDGTDVEGFGMVFLEAGACFKPSLAGKEGGQADAVLDGETGLIVDGTNQDAVTQALERLLSDKSLREKLGTRGRAYAETFDWPRVVQRTVEVVEKT